MLIQIDSRRRVSLQQQIYESIRQGILGGLLSPGSRLPSSRAVAQDLSVARMTAVLAFEQLIAEGYITSRAGAGTYVNGELPASDTQQPIFTGQTSARPPRVSRRGLALANTPRTIKKIDGPPRAFRLGSPALDRFPLVLWNRLVSRRMRQLTAAQLDYGDAAGLPLLREAIALHVSRVRGTVCSAEQVIVVGGAQQGLEMIARLLLDPGDEAWMEEPGYPLARAALISAGAEVKAAPVDAQGVIIEHIEKHAPRARLIYTTPSHQFPIGVQMSLPRRLALLRWARDRRAWIIEDDYDSEFRYGARAMPCLHGLDPDGRVIYVGSFSKTLFPALRLGYIIVPSDVHADVTNARRASDIHPPRLLQDVVASLMLDGHFERHLRRMNTHYAERLEALNAAALRYCGGALTLRPVTTGLHAVADLQSADAESVSQEAFARGVEAMPLRAYYSARRRSIPNALVLGFGGVAPKVITESVKRLAVAIEAAKPRNG
jgi:GntR family transcriptional regulator/MocR family aminotransferase